MTLLQSLLMAVLQGATELFPVSSLGHAVLLPKLLGWNVDQKTPAFLPFLVVLHLGTAIALFVYFWRDWLGFAWAVIGKGQKTDVIRERKIFLRVCIATLPAIILGFMFEHSLRDLFGTPVLAAVFLIVNGFILFIGEKLKKRGHKKLEDVSIGTSFLIGGCQALALIPGISRSGATMVGGLLAGLHTKEAARFSFLLATPIIAGAGVLEVPKIVKAHTDMAFSGQIIIVAGMVAALTAYISLALLMRYFKKNEIDALKPFAFYCWGLGVLALLVLRMP